MSQHLNLKALRCPAAMIYVRRAITSAINEGFNGIVVISTIEPSMKRDLALFIASCDKNIRISDEVIHPLSEDLKREWLEEGEVTMCELEGIESTREFALTFS